MFFRQVWMLLCYAQQFLTYHKAEFSACVLLRESIIISTFA